VYISPIWETKTPGRIWQAQAEPKFCLVVDVCDESACFKFVEDRLKVWVGLRVRMMLLFSIDFDGRPYNALTLRLTAMWACNNLIIGHWPASTLSDWTKQNVGICQRECFSFNLSNRFWLRLVQPAHVDLFNVLLMTVDSVDVSTWLQINVFSCCSSSSWRVTALFSPDHLTTVSTLIYSKWWENSFVVIFALYRTVCRMQRLICRKSSVFL